MVSCWRGVEREAAVHGYLGSQFRLGNAPSVLLIWNHTPCVTTCMDPLVLRYCAGDFFAAVILMAKGRARIRNAVSTLLPPAWDKPTVDRDAMDLVRHRLFVRCARASSSESQQHGATSLSTAALVSMDAELTAQIADLGRWLDTDQLPAEYNPNLTARAWHARGQWPKLEPLFDLLEEFQPLLAAEYAHLRDGGRVLEDQDCIQHGAGAAWSRFEITGVWNSLGASGCSVHSPVACELLRRAREVSPVALVRMGYSAVKPGTWIKPHHGMTNSKLKLHLGVVVPASGKRVLHGCGRRRICGVRGVGVRGGR